MKSSQIAALSVVGIMNALMGVFLSSGIWVRIYALTWPSVDATITEIKWYGPSDPNAAMAGIFFVIDGHDNTYDDSIFVKPFNRSNVPEAIEKIKIAYPIGSNIKVKFKRNHALLPGFPKDYEWQRFMQLVLGLLCITPAIKKLITSALNSAIMSNKAVMPTR